MDHMKIIKSLFIIYLLIFSLPALAQPVPEDVVQAALVSESTAIEAETPFRLAISLKPLPGWHTYWENPGDAGLPVSLAWTLPEGFTAGSMEWPIPTRMDEGPLTVYGYSGDIFLPVAITPPQALGEAEYTLKVTVNLLVCKEICIPESETLEITLPSGTAGASVDKPLFAAHDANRPAMVPLPATYTVEEKSIRLSVPRSELEMKNTVISDAFFFTRESGVVSYSGKQQFVDDKQSLQLLLPRTDGMPDGMLSGILAVTTADSIKYFDIGFQPSQMPLAATQPDLTFAAVLLFALLGGIILNLMPCVLPVLSLKALALVKKAGSEAAHAKALGIAYTLGILVSFALFAGLLIALQQAGNAVGWGFQMQSPAFVTFLIYLLFLVGLNLSGLFHLPTLMGHVGSTLANEDSARGSFLTGVLATAVATPCTAPFMASAVGAALAYPAWQSMLVFLALGFGLALPFLLISFFPRLLKFLPKPGAWMDTFKKLLALPMYASVLWLLWVLMQQTSENGFAVALMGITAIFLAVLIRKRTLVIAACAAALLTLPALGWFQDTAMSIPSTHTRHGIETIPYTPEKLEALRAAGKPVFVDATAAWCITCQLNARVAIHTDKTMEAFKQHGVTLMIADWTRQNPDISAWLASFGYQGVPLYVFYPADGGKPQVLPQLLTEDIIINTIQP